MTTLSVQKTSSTQRSCVACRNKTSPTLLLKVVLDPQGKLHVDYLSKLPGRGAYVCPSFACIKKAAEQGGFARSFKTELQTNSQQILQEAQEASLRQIKSLFAIANRAKCLSAGHTQTEFSLRHETAQLLFLSQDASTPTKNKFQQWASRLGLPVYQLLTQEEIAPCVGLTKCSLLTIDDPIFAKKIMQELRRATVLFSQKTPHLLQK